jgi:hypothetical protein
MSTILKQIKINVDLLKAIEKRDKDENTSEDKIFNEIIEKGLKNSETKIPEHLILNKDTYNPDSEKRRKCAGIGATDKSFDAVKVIREMRSGYL